MQATSSARPPEETEKYNHNPMNLKNILKMDREKGNKSLKYFQLPQL